MLPETVVSRHVRTDSMSSRALLQLAQFRKPSGRRFACALPILFLLLIASAAAEDQLSTAQREAIIRAFLAEHLFVHHALPRGKSGIQITQDGKITPSEAEMNRLIAQFGPAAKPGEHAQITAVRFVSRGIAFDINGGPVKRKSWKDHINVGVNGIDPSAQQQADDSVNSNGSVILLALNGTASSMTVDHIKDLLSPILDFKAMTSAEAYEKSLPPALAAACKGHHPLVGMDKDMVISSKGRPPRRIRESQAGQDYEEWIYGAPPQDVEFIRFVGDKVVRIEEMKVTGEKLVRTQDEVGNLNGALAANAPNDSHGASTNNASADPVARPNSIAAPQEDERRSAPTLLRPGEQSVNPGEAPRDPHPNPPPDSSAPLPAPN